MFDYPARVLRPSIPADSRILVISDIHANLPYLKGLLSLAGFSQKDTLILDGDFLEKGPECINTLRYVMELCKGGNVYPVCGNCDGWDDLFRWDSPEQDARVLRYVRWSKHNTLREMIESLGTTPEAIEDFTAFKPRLLEAYGPEFAFLSTVPHIIETPHFLFAHGGIRPGKSPQEHNAWEVKRYDNFRADGTVFDKWVVVGHWPVVLYGTDTVCAAPVIDREHKTISLDGGCVLKDDGQLNALIIPNEASEDFSYLAYDPFPVRRVKTPQAGGGRSYYVRWGDSTVQVLSRGEEFSRCRHLRTGYELDILTKYLFTGEEVTNCNDCTDYVLPLAAGDEVRVVETTSRGYFVKHNSVSGWYYGELE